MLSFPRGTEMFQFPPFAPAAYGLGGWTFGHPGLNARLTAPPGLSQSSTPFIACRRQDIPHTPLVAWPRRPCPRWCRKQLRRCGSTGPQVGRSNDPSLNQGSCRDSHRPAPTARRRSKAIVKLQLLPHPELSKNNTWFEAPHPQKDSATPFR